MFGGETGQTIGNILQQTVNNKLNKLKIVNLLLKVELENFQKHVLHDIFQKNMENKSIENELEAWLMFYSTQDPERIIELINKYPDVQTDVWGRI